MGKHQLCTICHKPIVLVPSAEERAKKYGGTPEKYRDLFREHASCISKRSREQVRELIERDYS